MKLAGFLLLAAALLCAIAWVRAPEYDEAYSIFLTAGHARPAWPAGAFTAGSVRWLYAGHAGFGQIAHDLRVGDVHPPLYFWALEIWRGVIGPSWYAARLLSVLFTLGGLWLLARIAAGAKIPVIPALALTLFAYGFAYTGIVARGFALAQLCNIAGVFLLLLPGRRAALAAGWAFGAACFTNYLAVFTGGMALAWLLFTHPRRLPAALAGLLPFLPACAWFYVAQRNSRIGQFQAFAAPHALALLAKDSGAAIFGGLPLYAGRYGPMVALALAGLFLCGLALVLMRRHAHAPLFALLAAATPCGLLALGVIFGNTPIEIRYLAFSLPWLAMLLAPALPRPLLGLMLTVQAAAIAGLALAPATMQPQAAAARAAAADHDALVLLPFGNDGVGIPGPFIEAAPDNMRILLVKPGMRPQGGVLASLAMDNASRAVLAQLAPVRFNQTGKIRRAGGITAVLPPAGSVASVRPAIPPRSAIRRAGDPG